MTGIGFHHRATTSCDLCDRDTPPEDLSALHWGETSKSEACASCKARFDHGGRELTTRLRPFTPAQSWHKVGVRLNDLTELATWVVSQCAGADAMEIPTDAKTADAYLQSSRAALSAAADRDAEIPAPGERGNQTAIFATALVAGAILDLAVLSKEELSRIRMRLDERAAMELLFALHCHYRARTQRVSASGIEHDTPKHRTALLEAAERAYLMGDPPAEFEWLDRLVILQADLEMERGEYVRAHSRLAPIGRIKGDAQAAQIVDPRGPHLYALSLTLQSQVAAADIQQRLLATWCTAPAHRTHWPDVTAATYHNLFLREMSRRRMRNWDQATAALATYCKLVPQDAAARFELAHSYLARSQGAAAREILESVLDEDTRSLFRDCYEDLERREEGVYLYATCLVKIARSQRDTGDTARAEDSVRQAAAAVARHLESGSEARRAGDWDADLHRVRGECEALLGKYSESFACLQASYQAGDREAARDAWTVLHAWIVETIASGEGAALTTLADTIAANGPLLRQAFGAKHLAILAVEVAMCVQLAERDQKQLDITWGPSLSSKHPDGATWLAYEKLGRHSAAQAWREDVTAESMGAQPIPFRMLRDLRSAWTGWPDELRQTILSRVVPCLVASQEP